MNDTEVWKAIEGYNGDYEVSDIGRVRSSKHNNVKILKQGRTALDSLTVQLCNGEKQSLKYVHRLVLETFQPHPKNTDIVKHKNGIGVDNRLENLEWSTRSGSMYKALTKENRVRGENSALAKLTDEEVKDIRCKYYETDALTSDIAKEYNINDTTVRLLVTNKRRKTAPGPVNQVKTLKRPPHVVDGISTEDKAKMIAAYKLGGYTLDAITKDFNARPAAVKRLLKNVEVLYPTRITTFTPHVFEAIYMCAVLGYKKIEIAREFKVSTHIVQGALKGVERAKIIRFEYDSKLV